MSRKISVIGASRVSGKGWLTAKKVPGRNKSIRIVRIFMDDASSLAAFRLVASSFW